MDHELRDLYFKELATELQLLVDPSTGLLSTKYSRIITCPLCNAAEEFHTALFIKQGYTFVRCEKCGMIFTNPQVDVNLVTGLYGEAKSNNLWVELQKSAKEQQWKKDYYKESIDLLKKYRDLHDTRLLDIGCSTGYFLKILRNEQPSWFAEGIELNKKAVEYARKQGLSVYDTLLENLDQELMYDIFTMFGVLEHLTDPRSMLKDIKRRANQSGCLVLAIVPNAYSLYHMFLQHNSVSFDGRNHLLYFSADTLARLFSDNGFQVLHLDTMLTGISNIKRQMQWFDPNSNATEDKYLSGELKQFLNSGQAEKMILQYNLGLRLRILAKYTGI